MTTIIEMMKNDSQATAKLPIGYLLLKEVAITGANSISSPITYGFPAVTGFLGAIHALNRKLLADDDWQALGIHINLGGVLLACHGCQPQVFRTHKYANYTFNQTRNPIKKDGKTASIIEEGKCNLTMSFVVEVIAQSNLTEQQQALLIQKVSQYIQQQRIAGGSVQGMARIEPVRYIPYDDIDTVIPLLMPAFVLMEAQDDFAELIDKMQADNPTATALDTLLDVFSLHHVPVSKSTSNQQNNEQTGAKVEWHTTSAKTGYGWLVPMPIGYQAISQAFEAGGMQNARNPEYPSQYVEAIYGLGKWIYPYHLKSSDRLMSAFWRYEYDADNQLYLTKQVNPFGADNDDYIF